MKIHWPEPYPGAHWLDRSEERAALADQLPKVQADSGAAMTVREVHLMKSDLRPSGAVYTSLATVTLENPNGQ